MYSQLDINHFHLILRSVFDYLASVIRTLAIHPDQVGSSTQCSFGDFQNKVLSNPTWAANKLGADLAEFISSCEWFNDVKKVRDSITHFGAERSPLIPSLTCCSRYTMVGIYEKQ